ncbi:hypothetical protein CEXT_357421 [Caerostris extrusa]|uniref:Uncharacterized protein n=1 Tax=Caerostris extrusa TaxID=172846 RepID=A0AAV4XJC0_CAEEX|nr:hypothetical protein CEXT_357421 [Caerostris extrusa]
MANPPEDDDPRLECSPDPGNFAAQIAWEGDDDGYPVWHSKVDVQSTNEFQLSNHWPREYHDFPTNFKLLLLD